MVEEIHVAIAQQSGGAAGLRDARLLESALARPQNRLVYDPDADLFDLAASLGFGLARNHPFVDGNKRIAFVAAAVFLDVNGCEFTASEADVVVAMLSLAAGESEEAEFAAFLRQNARGHRRR